MLVIANLVANLPMLLCLILGAALIVVEVFLPGFGLPGISGIVLLGVGVSIAGAHFGALTALSNGTEKLAILRPI